MAGITAVEMNSNDGLCPQIFEVFSWIFGVFSRKNKNLLVYVINIEVNIQVLSENIGGSLSYLSPQYFTENNAKKQEGKSKYTETSV